MFAFLIAYISCLEGASIGGSARSVGRSVGEHTTSSVVQSIFVVILLAAIAALCLWKWGW